MHSGKILSAWKSVKYWKRELCGEAMGSVSSGLCKERLGKPLSATVDFIWRQKKVSTGFSGSFPGHSHSPPPASAPHQLTLDSQELQ